MSAIACLTVTGDAHACGLAHGTRFAREIAENIETYLRRFAASGLARDQAFVEGRRWLAAIVKTNPAYAEEMRGIAEGCAGDETAIALLNARYELVFGLFGKEARQELLAVGADGCTTFGLLPEVTADRHTWLGQNWDWLEGVHGRTFVLRVERTHAPSFVCLTEAGIAGGKMGVNECGIGLVENGLASSRDGRNPYSKPFHVRCREVLDAQSLDEALAAIGDGPRTASANFVMRLREVGGTSTAPRPAFERPRAGLFKPRPPPCAFGIFLISSPMRTFAARMVSSAHRFTSST